MCVPLPHEQDTNSADTAYEIVCLRILHFCTPFPSVWLSSSLLPEKWPVADHFSPGEGEPTMTPQQEESELPALFDGLKTDAEGYFKRAEEALPGGIDRWIRARGGVERDRYWGELPEEIRSEAQRLDRRLVSLMGQVARAIRNAPLASEADQRDVMTGTKAMRAALRFRNFRSWDAEILNNEDIVLGVTPAGQSDDEASPPKEAGRSFTDWTDKISTILDLVVASSDRYSTLPERRGK
jgi:hypothetical protein